MVNDYAIIFGFHLCVLGLYLYGCYTKRLSVSFFGIKPFWYHLIFWVVFIVSVSLFTFIWGFEVVTRAFAAALLVSIEMSEILPEIEEAGNSQNPDSPLIPSPFEKAERCRQIVMKLATEGLQKTFDDAIVDIAVEGTDKYQESKVDVVKSLLPTQEGSFRGPLTVEQIQGENPGGSFKKNDIAFTVEGDDGSRWVCVEPKKMVESMQELLKDPSGKPPLSFLEETLVNKTIENLKYENSMCIEVRKGSGVFEMPPSLGNDAFDGVHNNRLGIFGPGGSK